MLVSRCLVRRAGPHGALVFCWLQLQTSHGACCGNKGVMVNQQRGKPRGDRRFIRGAGWEAGMWQSHSCWTDSGSCVFILTSPFLFPLGERTINMEQIWAGQERKLSLSAENYWCSQENFRLKMLTVHYKIKFKLWKRNKNKMLAAIKKTSTV